MDFYFENIIKIAQVKNWKIEEKNDTYDSLEISFYAKKKKRLIF